MIRNELTDFWELLDLTEDFVRGGVRKSHASPPAEMGFASTEAPPVAPDGHGNAAGDGGGHYAAEGRPPRGEREAVLASIAAEVASCEQCGLCSGRTHTVPGEGVVDPLVMVIGEGPGADEDRSGRPFVGRAGQYLDKWLAAIQLSRTSNAFIGNVVKCRPPGNRDPLPEESLACRPYLDRQIEVIRPKAILAVGRIASQQLLGTETGIGRLRGGNYSYKGIPLIVTYHPSGVLRNPSLRQAVWDDLKRLRALLESGNAGE